MYTFANDPQLLKYTLIYGHPSVVDLKNLKKLILTSKFPSQGHAFQFLLRWAVEDLDEVEHLDFYDFLKNAIQIVPFLRGNELHSPSEETRNSKKDLCGLHAHLLRKLNFIQMNITKHHNCLEANFSHWHTNIFHFCPTLCQQYDLTRE